MPHHCRRCVNNVINPPSLHAQLVIPFLLGPGHCWDEELCSQDVTVDPRVQPSGRGAAWTLQDAGILVPRENK